MVHEIIAMISPFLCLIQITAKIKTPISVFFQVSFEINPKNHIYSKLLKYTIKKSKYKLKNKLLKLSWKNYNIKLIYQKNIYINVKCIIKTFVKCKIKTSKLFILN